MTKCILAFQTGLDLSEPSLATKKNKKYVIAEWAVLREICVWRSQAVYGNEYDRVLCFFCFYVVGDRFHSSKQTLLYTAHKCSRSYWYYINTEN